MKHSSKKDSKQFKESDRKKMSDAKESGYVGKNGKAVSMAKPDVVGSPTGAFTDIGAGRSSVVKPHHHKEAR